MCPIGGHSAEKASIMFLQMMKGKIHRATVTQADLNYVGSITIDEELMAAAGIREFEKVAIADVDNGNRFETYTMKGAAGSGVICVNGAAAHCVSVGDKVIIMNYGLLTPEEADSYEPKIVIVGEGNKPIE